MTLGYIFDGEKVLLGLKKRGFAIGKWNGYGGKAKEGEDIESALKREFLEEAGIKVIECEKRGVVSFQFKDGDLLEVHIFKILKHEGSPLESEEMFPGWFNVHELPFDKMWVSDLVWMPLFLEGSKFEGDLLFENTEKILCYNIKKTDSLV